MDGEPNDFWEDEDDDADLLEITRRSLPETVVWTSDWTTGSLLEQIGRGVFDLEPPFQRRSVWSDRKASLYIESLLLGCPVPAITLAEMPVGSPQQYVVIDGKQRLTTLRRFATTGELTLSGLEVLSGLAGKKYPEVEGRSEFARFQNLPIRTVIVRNWSHDEVLHFIFNRLNTQVTPLSTHELRRSLLPGAFTNYLDRRSASSAQLRRILNISEADYRLRDAELLLRAISFVNFFKEYRGNLKQFLDRVTKRYNRHWNADLEAQLNAVVDEIEAAIDTVYAIFGTAAFQRHEDGEPVGRFNRAVFDVLVLGFKDLSVREQAVSSAPQVREAYREMMMDPTINSYFESTTKTRQAVQGRSNAWLERLAQVTGINPPAVS